MLGTDSLFSKCVKCRKECKEEEAHKCLVCRSRCHFLCCNPPVLRRDPRFKCDVCQSRSVLPSPMPQQPSLLEGQSNSIDNRRQDDYCEGDYEKRLRELTLLRDQVDQALGQWQGARPKRSQVEGAIGGVTELPIREPAYIRTSSTANEDLAANMQRMACRLGGTNDLPKFGGAPQDWLPFKVAFESSTAECGYSDIQNLARLQKALHDKARDRVALLLCMPGQVANIMKKLEAAFGNVQNLLWSALEDINKMQPLREDLKNVMDYLNRAEHVLTLLELNDESTRNILIIKAFQNKLTPMAAMSWANYRGLNTAPDLRHFATFLADLTHQAVSVGVGVEFSNTKPERRRVLQVEMPVEDVESSVMPAKAPTSNPSRVPQKPKMTNNAPTCVLNCTASHRLDKCPLFLAKDVAGRWECVKANRVCFNCFGRHNMNSCYTRNRKCGVDGCPKSHNALLHEGMTVLSISTARAKTFFPIIPVAIGNGDRIIETHAVLDSGSAVTLIENSLVEELGLCGEESPLEIKWMNEVSQIEKTSQIVSFILSGNGGKQFGCKGRSIKTLNLPRQSLCQQDLIEEGFDHLPVVVYDIVQPRMLIGLDNARLMASDQQLQGKSPNVIAAQTPLGWVIKGRRVKEQSLSESVLGINIVDRELEEVINDYIEAENLGRTIYSDDKVNDDPMIQQMVANTKQVVGGCFETRLLWKNGIESMPNNRSLALKRFYSFEAKLEKDPLLRDKINKIIAGHVAKGYARKIVEAGGPRTWYLPIFCVQNPNKPGKVRLVWDAAAKYDKLSLNSCLEKGPDLLEPLVNVLLRFRCGEIALTGDIEEMFHRVKIAEEDWNAQRFLWRDSPSKPIDTYVFTVSTFGAACSPAIAQFVKNLNARRFQQEHAEAVIAITKNHYVDDWLQSMDSADGAIALAKQVYAIHKEGGFHIRGWKSNSRAVMEALGSSDGEEQSLDREGDFSVKVLGMRWCCRSDQFRFAIDRSRYGIELFNNERVPTKREVLRIAMSIFDPLGLISFATVRPRIIMRETWRTDGGWDDCIKPQEHEEWNEWTKSLSIVESFRFSRWNGALAEPELHVFTDASKQAIAAVSYVRGIFEGAIITSLMMSKCRLAPLLERSVPRLELEAAVLGVELAEIILKAQPYEFKKITFWTDAADVLCWINNGKQKMDSFVGTRIGRILRASNAKDWCYVKSNENPADFPTKVRKFDQLPELWLNGPPFLFERSEVVLAAVERRSTILDIDQVATWEQLLLNFVQSEMDGNSPSELSDENLAAARRRAFAQAQECYATEIRLLRQRKMVPAKSEIADLNPFIDEEGLLRMEGRLVNVEYLPFNTRNPIILPPKHRITELFVYDLHCRLGHQNHQTTLNEMRQMMICHGMKALLNRIIMSCKICAHHRAKPMAPQMSALPKCRTAAYIRPFSYTGVDCFGPIEVAVGRRVEKRWGVILTCLTTRAVHLEIAHTANADSCLMALQNFMSRRGVPKEIRSDNGTNFVAAARILQGLNGERPQWVFNPPSAPHFGGAWERLVRSVKEALHAMDMPRRPTDEVFRHLITKAEGLINMRPLTDMPLNGDAREAITPNHFLLLSSNGCQTDAPLRVINGKDLEIGNQLLDEFWKRWIVEYLPTIAIRTKWSRCCTPLEVGDMVYVCDENKRGEWKKGVVETVCIDGNSGQVRQATVNTGDGIVRRPAVKLAKIKCCLEEGGMLDL